MTSRWKFWLITVAALLSIAVTSALGCWQLSRAAQKEAVQADIDAKAAMPRLDGPALGARSDPTSELHRGVSLRGHWMPQWTIFLDNRLMNGKVGLYVMTPLQLEGGSGVILVQRGWVARNFVDRASVPTIETSTALVDIQGRIAPPPSKLYELGGPERGLIRQNLDLAHFRAETGLSLPPVVVKQIGMPSEGLLREWPLANLGVDKNYGYAFQWFGLSGLIAILYVWFQIVRRFIYPRRA
ncbi:SURF1 family protein [Rhodoferax sp.]|uniref:SURF1 family protein n=1 Tax=Rhodoferax sp. TaxID=50421 RepID=UPI0025FAA112|nr:SURF1 family protein [Rhodoferax sp.]